jgi:hypothetical protein
LDIGFRKVSAEVPHDLAGASWGWALGAREGHLDGKSVTLLTHHFSSAWFILFGFVSLTLNPLPEVLSSLAMT